MSSPVRQPETARPPGDAASRGPSTEAQGRARPLVDVGAVLAGRMTSNMRDAVRKALDDMRARLSERLPEFEWRVTVIRRPEARVGLPADPMRLVDLGVLERDTTRWDFAFVVTEMPLLSDERPFMMGAPSQALDVAVLSTARLQSRPGDRDQAPKHALRQRLTALMMHLFGHLNDVGHSDDPEDFMFDLHGAAALDSMHRLSDEAVEHLRWRLREVADPRVEERGEAKNRLGFILRAAWPNRHEILTGVLRMQPWRFPIRFSRLTTAAVSALLVLIVTAEAWELGMSQPPWRVALLSTVSLMATTAYVVSRQSLLKRLGHRLSEQLVVGGFAVSVAVLLGMFTTYAMLFSATWLAAKLFYSAKLVSGWTSSISTVTETHYLCLAGFVASAGMLTGAMGASFEEGGYFRRVALLDEET